MRNPVGPLPSSIYWRRRAVAATLVALLALLVVWIVTSGGGGGKKDGPRSGGAAPATSITPGPSGSGPAISEQPGGRDESGGSGGDGGGAEGGTDSGGDGGKNGDPAASGGAGGTGVGGAGLAGAVDGSVVGGSGGSGGSVGTGDGGTGGAGRQVPPGSGLPNCAPNSLTLRLDTTKVAYEPGEKPTFRLIAANTSDITCKVDFGPKAVVITITDAEDDQVWSSKDCPKSGSLLFEVPAGGSITRTIQWNRAESVPQCATPPAKTVGPGTYLVEARTAGASVKQGQKSIRLDKD